MRAQLTRCLKRFCFELGYSSVGRASDCRLVQPSDGPWFDSGWPDFTCLDPERPIQLRQGCNINHMLTATPQTHGCSYARSKSVIARRVSTSVSRLVHSRLEKTRAETTDACLMLLRLLLPILVKISEIRNCLDAWSVIISSPAVAQLVEYLTVDLCSHQTVPGWIPGGRISRASIPNVPFNCGKDAISITCCVSRRARHRRVSVGGSAGNVAVYKPQFDQFDLIVFGCYL